MSYNTAQPYIATYVLFEKDGKVAFVLRSNTDWMNNYYGLPSGKVEKDESYMAAAIREAKEEVGVVITSQDLKPTLVVHRYEPSSNAKDWVDMYFTATEWQGKLYNAEPHIHSELTWLDPKKLPKNVIPSVKFAIEEIQKGKTYTEYGWEN